MSQALSALAVGSLLKVGTYKVEGSTILPIIWKIIDKNHTGYPASSVTVLANQIIDLRGFDAKEAGSADANRVSYGNNRYLSSNLRQWLNSGGVASAWWAAQNPGDGVLNTNNHDATPADAGFDQPTGYNDIKGFLGNFTPWELIKILDTTLTVARNTITDTGATSETVSDKVFLLSNTEVGLANENSIAEGTLFSIFAANANRIATATAQCIASSLSASKPASGAGWYWWLRTPNAGNSYRARNVFTGGTLDNGNAYGGAGGVRPALNLASGILVSDSVDSDGCYIILPDDRLEFVLASPIQTSAAARKIVVSAILTVPTGATLTINACNNGLDVSPTWEDVTADFTAKQAYTFTNTTKTNAIWGVNIQFQILIGTATATLEVKSFGFSFE
jgi:hypothetical protein